MVDWIGPSIDQKLAEGGIVAQQAVIRKAVQPQSIVIQRPNRVGVWDPTEGGGAIGMQETVFLNMAENLRTSLTLLSMYLASPSSLRLDSEQWSKRLPGGIAKSSRILQKLFPSSLRPPPSTLMMAGHLEADDGKTAGMA